MGTITKLSTTADRTLHLVDIEVTIVSRSDALSGALQGQGFGVRIITPVAAHRAPTRAA